MWMIDPRWHSEENGRRVWPGFAEEGSEEKGGEQGAPPTVMWMIDPRWHSEENGRRVWPGYGVWAEEGSEEKGSEHGQPPVMHSTIWDSKENGRRKWPGFAEEHSASTQWIEDERRLYVKP